MATTYANFSRLSLNVYLHSPEHDDTDKPIIVLCTWLAAHPKLVSRYADRFITEFAGSPILLITSNVSDFVSLSTSGWAERLDPALDVLLTDLERKIHAGIYSNGGANAIIKLAQAYRARTQDPLVIDKMVIDSAPGSPEIGAAHQAMLLSINPPRYAWGLAWALMWVYLGLAWTYMSAFGVENPIESVRARLNDPKLLMMGTERVYVYSKSDLLVDWQWVEASAEDAKSKGWKTKLEEFKGSKHVAHALVDKERYWNIITDTLA